MEKSNHLSKKQKVLFLVIFVNQLLLTVGKQNEIIPIQLTDENIPMLKMNYVCKDIQLDLLIDTGSSQLSLADSQCSQCIKTVSLCPHIKQSTHKILYLSAVIQGQFSYLQQCGMRFKFFCIKKSLGYKLQDANGILGLNGNKTGQQFMKIILKLFQIQQLSLSLYYGKYQHKLILGKIPHQYVKEKIFQIERSIQNRIIAIDQNNISNSKQTKQLDSKWKIIIQQIRLAQNILGQKQLQMSFDSGAAVIVFPTSIFQKIFQVYQNISNQKCFISENRIICPSQFYQNIPDIQFQIKQSSKMLTLSKRQLSVINPSNDFQIVLNIMNQTNENMQHIIIGGIPFFYKYLITFGLQDITRLVIYESNRDQLIVLEQKNTNLLILLYLTALFLATFALIRIIQFIKSSISNKIII